jgi:CTP-dependent riboflavin kinase
MQANLRKMMKARAKRLQAQLKKSTPTTVGVLQPLPSEKEVLRKLQGDGAAIVKSGYNPLSGKYLTGAQKTTLTERLEVLDAG